MKEKEGWTIKLLPIPQKRNNETEKNRCDGDTGLGFQNVQNNPCPVNEGNRKDNAGKRGEGLTHI